MVDDYSYESVVGRTANRSVESIYLMVDALDLAAAGEAQGTVDSFVMIAQDASLERMYMHFIQAANPTDGTRVGTMTVLLFQTLADGASKELLSEVSLAALPDEVLKIESGRAVMVPGQPVFLRLQTNADATDPWWKNDQLNSIGVSLHLLSTR